MSELKNDNRSNCASYWLPKLKDLEIPKPATVMFDMNQVDSHFSSAMRNLFWMKDLDDEQNTALIKFMQILKKAASEIGYPCFLRTGHSSQKHYWHSTCYVVSEERLLKNAQNIAEHNIMTDLKDGMPINVWLVRKLIDTNPAFNAFGGMPITREFRYFINEGKIICRHPYWPENVMQGVDDKDWKLKLNALNVLQEEDREELDTLAKKIATEFKGYWSVDFLQDKNHKWYVIDMAKGEDSYHWKGCPNAKKGKDED